MSDIKKIRCALVHDHVLLRQGLRRLLDDAQDMEVVAEAGSAGEALQCVAECYPDVVIADAGVFALGANQVGSLIQERSPRSKVLFLTMHEDGPSFEQERTDSASCAVQRTSAEELVEAVRRMHSAQSLTPGPARHDRGDWREEGLPPRARSLTAREREVLKLLAEGRTVRSAADVLGLSVKTVDAHKFNLMRKLGVHNKAELVMWAIQKRVVKLPAGF
jgi:two-component system, NarL family, response regulator NreC